MKLNELVKTARAADSSAFGNMNDKRVEKILRAAFAQVSDEIEATKEGQVVISGLGRFVVKNVERETDGVKETTRRVLWRQAKSD